MVPFSGWDSTVSRVPNHYEKRVNFVPQVPRGFWYSFNQPWNNGRQIQPWSKPVVKNWRPLDWDLAIAL